MKIAWLIQDDESMDWSPSLRLRHVNIYKHINQNNLIEKSSLFRQYQSIEINAFAYELASFDALIFASQSEYDYNLIRKVKEINNLIVILRDHCENIWNLPWEMECFAEADCVVCSSHVLTSETIEHGFAASCIEEPYESVGADIPAWQKPLVAGYIGGDFQLGELLRPIVESAGYEYIHVAYAVNNFSEDSKIKSWDEKSWRYYYSKLKVSLLPQRNIFPAKSAIKLVQALGNGIPTICSPMDAYTRIAKHNETTFFCENLDKWHKYLSLLKDQDICKTMCNHIKMANTMRNFLLMLLQKSGLGLLLI